MYKRNARNIANGIDLLQSLPDRSVAAVFCDPQYRSVLDRAEYGNEGDRMVGRASLPQMDDTMIAAFISEIGRVLQSSGHLFLFIDKYLLVSHRWSAWLPEITPMREVDCLIIDRERIGMGRRLRCRWDAMIVIQKGPTRAEGIWKNRAIPDVARAKTDRARHPHAKPIPLLQTLIECVTEPNDLVVDPCAGGFGVLDACRASGRVFIGCDLVG